ncbi:AAA family ATPase [Paenibacillus sp. GCM10027626]|uniref:AAA family ATPase n=1 Tax=Paenibacillus sp. GCM10027626 TaxID=3273411 RepID=UPI003644AD02
MNDHQMINEQFIIITGGPGAGKTTLLHEMKRRGQRYVPEVAREIIQSEISLNGDALPWKNTTKYRDRMLDHSIESYLEAMAQPKDHRLFFDRGIPDTLAYSKLISIPISNKLAAAVQNYRYCKQVFILPPWEEIYHTDHERLQGFDEAVATYRIMVETYTELGYELIEVPKLDVGQRADFVINS